ncbi:MAG: hypothetical protein M3Y22_10570, partial [Pseudomonadota bacterium]|nr:hypothetical protein [Pseudomonadota bacterium]
MVDIIDKAGASGKQDVSGVESVQAGDDSADAVQLLPPPAPSGAGDAAAVVHRLARAHVVPEALLAALEGPLGGAIATA